MSAEERKKVLQMVADGKISAEEAATLMRALEDSPEDRPDVIETAPGAGSDKTSAREFDEVRKRARSFAMIPLWVGVFITVVSAWSMLSVQQGAGFNFWFFCWGMPLVLGILLIALGARGQNSRWLYVNVDRTHQPEWPRNITLAFPLPLGLASWLLRNFGSHIEGLKHTNVDEVINAISMAKNIDEPLIVNVDETEGGERVQVFIG
jgi:hypothetical protein